jgi:enamine deaminase RidA (YjgF/YER057c/UK114 family)
MKHEIWQLGPDDRRFEISQAIENVILKLDKQKKNNEIQGEIVCLTFFVDTDKKEFYNVRRQIISKLKDIFKNPPAYSIIAQPPASGESLLLDIDLILSHGNEISMQYIAVDNEISYTKIETSTYCEYYFSGITVTDPKKSIEDKITDSYVIMDKVLNAEGLGMDNIIRQWNYLEDIIEIKSSVKGVRQNYQVLNNIRHEFYNKYSFSKGYPAATGIGMNSGGFVIECIAIKEKSDLHITPIKNPGQVSAYEYSSNVLVGSKIQPLLTPKFERAKLCSREKDQYELFISGTAAIHNEQSLAKGSVVEQTVITLDNIEKLIESGSHTINRLNKAIVGTSLYYLRVYIKYKDDYLKVKEICDKYASTVKPVYLIGDICRDELLIEIEGIINITAR